VRRTLIIVLAALAGLLMVPSATASASDDDYGPDEVYFEETGHYLGDDFLDFWREYGGIQTFGYPLTPEIQQDGLTVQYFERHVLEHHPDNPEDHQVLLRRLGAEAREARDLHNHEAFQDSSEADSGEYFEATSQNLQHGFLDYWENNGGLRIFGYPISAEFEHDGTHVQFLERAIIEWHPDNPAEWRVLFERLGAQAAERDGVDTSPEGHDGETPHYHDDLWTPPEPEPEPAGTTPPSGAPSDEAKWMEVDLTNQMFRAWEGETLVYEAVAATGRPAVPTLTGTFETYVHLRYDDMSGTTPDHGPYDLEDVPYVMYYDRGYGIHGTYWHNNFGTPMSAGCVNLTIQDAAWVFEWADVGTTVYVHGTTPGA
jgi:hypothetical protein